MNLTILLTAALLVSGIMCLGWLYQRRSGDAGIVDVLWTYNLGILALLYAVLCEGDLMRQILLTTVVGLWSLRLGTYILFDRVLVGHEDGRYQKLREHWGEKANSKFFWFFQAQGAADLFFSLPFIFIASNSSPVFSAWEYLGLGCWSIAFFGEWIADNQLRRFRRSPTNRGKTCQNGLWRYSRHPNYFFEWLHWLSYPLMLVGISGFYAALLCPAVMLFSLFKVTGIPHTEAQALRSRGEEYRRYQQQTSVFIPWFPKKVS